MSKGLRRWLVWGLTGLLATVVMVGLVTAPLPAPDRAESLATRIRCPVCQGESVADSPSEIAVAMRAIIAEQVAQGRSDQEILDFFAAKYGQWVLLDTPPRGRTLLLWVLPGLALLVGGALVVSRQASLPLRQWVDPRRRATAGTLALLVAFGGVAVFAARSLTSRPEGGFVTGNAARDLSTVTNQEMEEVLAANPDVVGMRLALANRYFEAGEFSAAVGHYLEVLDLQPGNPEALARLGWMAYLAGEAETAAGYEERALEFAPGYPEATWFLANIRLYGLDDPAGAVPLLEELAALPDLPADVRREVEARLIEARTAGG
ncbi:MAG: cytochrome c-type biogenesis protein CcmH [Acidimicrobiia bacterium]